MHYRRFLSLAVALALPATASPALAARAKPLRAPTAAVVSQGEFETARADFLARAATRRATLTDARHVPFLLDHGHPTPYVLVVMPGLYDSASAQRLIANRFYERGMNVVVGLLPGHWAQRQDEIDHADYTQYLAEEAALVATARHLGEKLVFAGHSTGALLAFREAMNEPRTAALLLSAPAFELRTGVKIAVRVGEFFHLSGNLFQGTTPDGLVTPYISPYAGEQVEKLIKLTHNQYGWVKNQIPAGESEESLYRKLFRRVSVPLVLLQADRDILTRNEISDLLPAEARGPVLTLRSERFDHGSIGRFFEFTAETKAEDRAESLRLLDAADRFLSEHLSLTGAHP